jgi:2-C-methyl-D-erythritol 4-phosphate cytidylyltransferase
MVAYKMALRLFPKAKSRFVHLGGVAVTELPLSGLVRVQPVKRTIIMCVAKEYDSLTPLHKKDRKPIDRGNRRSKQSSQQE